MTEHDFPIIEFDPALKAIVNPPPGRDGFKLPDRAVMCFPQDAIDSILSGNPAEPVHHLHSSMGLHPVHVVEAFGETIALFQPGLGAPFAAAFLDELIALGCRKIIVCGTCGVLDRSMLKGMVVVPTSAVRDEGTSYHYLPAGREVEPSQRVVSVIESVLKDHKCRYLLGKTWTTDAIYRETPARIARRHDEGCVVVEMEASALFSVARFRGVEIGQLLCCGDDVSGEVWNSRREDSTLTGHEKMLWLSLEVCARL